MKLSGTIILAPLLGLQLVYGQSSDSASSTASSTGVFTGLTASSGSTVSAGSTTASGSATTTIARLTTAPVASASANSTSYTPKNATLWLPIIMTSDQNFVASFLGADVCSTLSSYVLNCPSPTPVASCAVGPNMTYTTGPSFANYVRNGASTIACSSTSKGATVATCEATLKSNGDIQKTTVTISGTSLSAVAVLVTATPNITTTSTGSAIACTATTTSSSSSSTAGAAQATAFGGVAAGAVLVAAMAAM